MPAFRHLLLVGFVAILLAGCKKENANLPAEKGSATSPPVVAEVPPTPDDPKIVKIIEETKGVVAKKSGENIVSLDLRGLFPDDAADQANEFEWVKGLPKLSTLSARGPGVTIDAINHLKAHPSISVIAFDDCTQVRDDSVDVLGTLPKLVDVNLIKSDITNKALETLGKSKTIRRVRIARTKVTDEGIAHLTSAPQIELLDLLECSLLTNACAESVGKLPKLRNVKMPSAVDDSGMQHLANLKGLAALGLQYCRIGKTGLAHITDLKELKEINLYGATKVNDECVEILAQLPKLAKARLRETSIRGEAAEAFAEMKALVDLDLSESPVQDALMESLAKLPKLEKLNLWNTEVSDAGVAKLAGMTQLKHLNLDNLTGVSDDSLDVISKLDNLELLHLGGTEVTDDAMPKLHGLKKMKKLFITRTFVIEKDTVKELKSQLPDAEIEW